MNSQFLYRTGITMVDLFFNSFATILEMQRAFVSGAQLPRPATAKFGHSDQSGRFETGPTGEQVIPIPKQEQRISKRQVQSAKAYRVRTTAEVSRKAPNQPQGKTLRETSLKAGVKASHDSGVVEKQKKTRGQNAGKRRNHPNLGGDTKPRSTRKFHSLRGQ
jgi:hypothetical protein